MKIITWNCNMAFRKKAHLILAYNPDLLIIPECENPEIIKRANCLKEPTKVVWFGHNRNKGLAIFSYNGFALEVLDIHETNIKMIIPISVKSRDLEFILLAVWANNPNDPDGRYITQVWKAVQFYESLLGPNTLLMGDFNSNTIWDKPRRDGNHSTVVKFLEGKEIYSVYHKHYNQEQGSEKNSTFFMYRRKNKPYHIDYCFASSKWLKNLKSFEIGDFEFWTKYSDHVPVIVDFDLTIFSNNSEQLNSAI